VVAKIKPQRENNGDTAKNGKIEQLVINSSISKAQKNDETRKLDKFISPINSNN
jgi:hypothetical protein